MAREFSSEGMAKIVSQAVLSADVTGLDSDPIFYAVADEGNVVYISTSDGQEFIVEITEDTSHG